MEKIAEILPTLKMLKIAEYKNDFAVHFDTLDGYKHFMRGTWPEAVVVAMWSKFEAETGVYVLDVTETEYSPLTRVLKPITYLKNIGLKIVEPDYVYNYLISLLAKFNRGDRVLYTGHGKHAHLANTPCIIVGLKAEEIDGLWHYLIQIPGASEYAQVSEGRLTLNEAHPANKPAMDFINKDAGQVRKPAGPKVPVTDVSGDSKAAQV